MSGEIQNVKKLKSCKLAEWHVFHNQVNSLELNFTEMIIW